MPNLVYVIDPTSTEWNRGSFCYLPYLFVDSLKYRDDALDVIFLENFTIAELPNIDPQKDIYIALWSPTQKDICLELHRQFPKALFFGYYGFIEELGLPMRRISESEIELGLQCQGKSFKNFKTVLLSDCDSHIQGKFKGQWYPFHTSYGCPRGCSFCPSSKNTEGRVTTIPLLTVKYKLEFYFSQGYTNIHFTDEDLFANRSRAFCILEYCKNLPGMNLIALSHSFTLKHFITKYGTNILREAGVRLLEVGFEGEVLYNQKGITHLEDCIYLYEQCKELIYWLTLTFSPGETLESLNKTGQFLRLYGKSPDELLPRLKTNGTEGGLGQFFQPYPDLFKKSILQDLSLVSPFNATRLFPSYIPESFLKSKIKEVLFEREEELEMWCSLYHVDFPTPLISVGQSVSEILIQSLSTSYIQKAKTCIALAIAARLGIIK